MTALIPVPFTVTRYRCPLPECGRTRSSRRAVAEHIERCWHNPAARACKTCVHYLPHDSEPSVGYSSEEHCNAGLELPESPDGRRTLAVGCPRWEPEQPHGPAWARVCGQVHDGRVCTKPRVHDTNGCWGHYGPEVDPDARWVCTVELHPAGAERCPHCQPIPGRPGGES